MTAGLAGASGAYVSGAGGTPSNQPQALDTGAMWGLWASYISASTVQVAAGRARNIADDFDLDLAAAANINLAAANGIGGLDTGSEAASTWYHAWVVGSSTGAQPTGVIGSLAATFAGLSPNLPAGYDRGRRCFAFRNDGSSNILLFNQHRHTDGTRRMTYDERSFAQQTVLSGYSVVAYTTVNLASFVPPTAEITHVNFLGDSSSGIDSKVYFRPGGSAASSPVTQGELFGGDSGFVTVRCNGSQQIQVAVGSILSSVDVALWAYDDVLDD